MSVTGQIKCVRVCKSLPENCELSSKDRLLGIELDMYAKPGEDVGRVGGGGGCNGMDKMCDRQKRARSVKLGMNPNQHTPSNPIHF